MTILKTVATIMQYNFELLRNHWGIWYGKTRMVRYNGIAVVCFYDAERVLSAVAKFLVHFLV